MNPLARFRGREPAILAWRGWRAFVVRVRAATGGWHRRDARLRAEWTAERTAAWWRDLAARPVLVAPGGAEACRRWSEDAPTWRAALAARAAARAAGRFEVFDGPVDAADGAPPWLSDPRNGHAWPPAPYHTFGHYETGKSVPYDIKWPWELSRLGFLPDLMQAGVVANDPAPQRLGLALLASWDRADPIGHSANWAPMECSMRLLALALASEMLAAAPRVEPAEATLLPVLLASHAEWVEWVAERTESNGNHFDANLAALAVAGELLDGWHPRAGRWRALAERFTAAEILRQFDPDGSNFERATGYHRLVTELFLLTALAWRRRGRPLAPTAIERLAAAARYANALQRPDGRLALLGDNDSARVLAFDGRHTRDPGELLALASWFVGDPALAPPPGEFGVLPWLTGTPGTLAAAQATGAWAFPDGGVVVSRPGAHHLIVEAGEVGMRGRGGHGHNDILAFEWVVDRTPVIVDPGTLTYTGDRPTYDAFRSAFAHSTITVDGREPAELLGPWRIADTARPVGLSWAFGDRHDQVGAGHEGYRGLADPVGLRREWRFDRGTGALMVTDRVEAAGEHEVQRRLVFAPGWTVVVGGEGASARSGRLAIRVAWGQGIRAEVLAGRVATSYGRVEEAPVLVLTARTAGAEVLEISLVPGDSNAA